jgi:hypothetical protein
MFTNVHDISKVIKGSIDYNTGSASRRVKGLYNTLFVTVVNSSK